MSGFFNFGVSFRLLGCLAVLLGALCAVQPSPAAANAKYAGIVIDAKTGRTLYASSADARRYPASLTKVMTLYILFEEIERGRLTLDSRLKTSAYAAGRPPSKLGLRAGQTIRVRDAIKALAVKSANDAAVVVAEAIEGSEAAFARRMTRTARALGMNNTTFRNANGLPDSGQVTTARDMARLGIAIQDRFPEHYRFFSTRSYSWGKRRFANTNRLLGAVKGVDGIKTGYTRASGFNLLTSVDRDGRHTVAVVMGGRTGRSRNAHMVDLIKRYHYKAKRGERTAPLIATAPIVPPLPNARPRAAPVAVAASLPLRDGPAGPDRGPSETSSLASAPKKAATPDDPIGKRIVSANEVARLAYSGMPKPERNALAQLTRMVRSRIPLAAPAAPTAPRGPEQKRMPAGMPEVALASTQAGARTDVRPPVQPAAAVRATEPDSIPAGWHVQIGAVATEADALALLDKAKSTAGDLLASADPFTQAIDKGGTTLYRARFAGFSGKAEARSICNSLKRWSFACLAVHN